LTALSAGIEHACAIAADSTAWCWGANDLGQLGDGSTTDTTQPAPVTGARKFIAVTVGYSHSCGLEAAGDIYCWGDNSLGQLGDTLVAQASTPRLVVGGLTFLSVSAGAAHTCGVTTAGSAYCWGSDASGQLGSPAVSLCTTAAGSQPCTRKPTLVVGGLSFQSVSGGTQHSCGLTSGAVSAIAYCWGLNDHGQLGDGTNRNSTSPVRVGKQEGT